MSYKKIICAVTLLLALLTGTCAASTLEEVYRDDDFIYYGDLTTLKHVENRIYGIGVMAQSVNDSNWEMNIEFWIDYSDNTRSIRRIFQWEEDGSQTELNNEGGEEWVDIVPDTPDWSIMEFAKASLVRRGLL